MNNIKEIKKNESKESIWIKHNVAKFSDELFDSIDISPINNHFQVIKEEKNTKNVVQKVKKEILNGNR